MSLFVRVGHDVGSVGGCRKILVSPPDHRGGGQSTHLGSSLSLLGSQGNAPTAAGLNCAVEFYWLFTCLAGFYACIGGPESSICYSRMLPHGLHDLTGGRRLSTSSTTQGRSGHRRDRVDEAVGLRSLGKTDCSTKLPTHSVPHYENQGCPGSSVR